MVTKETKLFEVFGKNVPSGWKISVRIEPAVDAIITPMVRCEMLEAAAKVLMDRAVRIKTSTERQEGT